VQPRGDRIRLHFRHVHGGLTIRAGGKKLTGFALAGADKKFVWAEAVIDGDTIVVSSSEVAEPRHVRYGWAWNPLVNLVNKDGLPAATFRTDEWPLGASKCPLFRVFTRSRAGLAPKVLSVTARYPEPRGSRTEGTGRGGPLPGAARVSHRRC
jgi:hypothetical protein